MEEEQAAEDTEEEEEEAAEEEKAAFEVPGVVLHASNHTPTHFGNAHKRAALLMEVIRHIGGVSSPGSNAVITRKHMRARSTPESVPCIIQ